jgi:hypothetical protein
MPDHHHSEEEEEDEARHPLDIEGCLLQVITGPDLACHLSLVAEEGEVVEGTLVQEEGEVLPAEEVCVVVVVVVVVVVGDEKIRKKLFLKQQTNKDRILQLP